MTLDWCIDVGDVIEQLRRWPERSIHCIVTSPPYWRLRDYGVEGQIGAEATPREYVAKMVAVFAEAHRVLRDDGTLWLNLGDSYANAGEPQAHNLAALADRLAPRANPRNPNRYDDDQVARPSRTIPEGFKPKDLIGIPWRVALALQEWGWYLRCDVVWSKPNPLPESIEDRPSKNHEYIFMLTKSARYYYDSEAVKEASSPNTNLRASQEAARAEAERRQVGGLSTQSLIGIHPKAGTREEAAGRRRGRNKQNASYSAAVSLPVTKRNRRSVWEMTTQPYPEAHFATFPEALPDLCIRASTSEHGCCPQCGTPFRRILAEGEADREHQRACGADAEGEYRGEARKAYSGTGAQNASDVKRRILAGMVEKITIGWRPLCGCAVGMPDEPDAFEQIATQTGEDALPDECLETGRKGFNRPRLPGQGIRRITRYEQRRYAEQLQRIDRRRRDIMAAEAGPEAFAHYLRIDRSGARPIPPALLEQWIERGWLARVEIPNLDALLTARPIVADIFCGSGTTGAVAIGLGRSFRGIELKPEYAVLSRKRIGAVAPLLAVESRETEVVNAD